MLKTNIRASEQVTQTKRKMFAFNAGDGFRRHAWWYWYDFSFCQQEQRFPVPIGCYMHDNKLQLHNNFESVG
jgi:hypothetical protein